jgi:hypothetical protein
MTDSLPDPVVDLSDVREVARDAIVIGNRGIQLVPNVGIIGGSESVLVVETGMGPSRADWSFPVVPEDYLRRTNGAPGLRPHRR